MCKIPTQLPEVLLLVSGEIHQVSEQKRLYYGTFSFPFCKSFDLLCIVSGLGASLVQILCYKCSKTYLLKPIWHIVFSGGDIW